MSIAPLEFIINPFSSVSHEFMNVDCGMLTSFFEDSTKIISNRSSLGYYLPESVENIERSTGKTKKKTKLQKLKELGLLGAIKDSEITSENYKKHLDDYFGNSGE